MNDKAKVGALGEDAASKKLKRDGYKIVGRNVRAGKSEFDIIAVKDNVLAFVEVKTRAYNAETTYLDRPADAVNKEKASYLIRGAANFCRDTGSKYADYFKRIDIVEVYLEKRGSRYRVSDIKHFENAVGKNS